MDSPEFSIWKFLNALLSMSILLLIIISNIFRHVNYDNGFFNYMNHLFNFNLNGILLSLLLTIVFKYFFECENSNFSCRPGNKNNNKKDLNNKNCS